MLKCSLCSVRERGGGGGRNRLTDRQTEMETETEPETERKRQRHRDSQIYSTNTIKSKLVLGLPKTGLCAKTQSDHLALSPGPQKTSHTGTQPHNLHFR